MSHTIYGDYTHNNVYVSDMVDIKNDIVFYNGGSKEYYLRFSGWFESEKMEDNAKPCLALFLTEDPFAPLWAVKLEEGKNYTDQFGYALKALGEEISKFYSQDMDAFIRRLKVAEQLKKDKVYENLDENSCDATDNQGYCMDCTIQHNGKKYFAYINLMSGESAEYQMAEDICEIKEKKL